MEFVVDGNQVMCVRFVTDARSGQVRRDIVSRFDTHLHSIAPHVAACLKPDEINELKSWLHERRELQKTHATDTLLRSIPELLSRAEAILNEKTSISENTIQQLQESVCQFSQKLSYVETHPGNSGSLREEMTDSEALKERLDIVRNNL